VIFLFNNLLFGVGISGGSSCQDLQSLDFKNLDVEISNHGKVRFKKGIAFTSDGGEAKDWKHRIVQDDILRPETSTTLRLIKIESVHTTGSGFWEHVIIYKCRRGDLVKVFHKSFLGGVKVKHDLKQNIVFTSGEWSKDDPACCPSKKKILTYHWNREDEIFELMYPPVPESEVKTWKPVENKDLSFQLSCPENWSVTEFRSDFRLCSESDSFCIHVQSIENPTALSSFEFFRKMEKEANSGDIGGLRYSDLVQEKIGELDAVTLKDVFTYDSSAEETYIAVGNKVFILTFTSMYAEEVENQEELDKHSKMNAIARSIIRAFKVVTLAMPKVHEQLR